MTEKERKERKEENKGKEGIKKNLLDTGVSLDIDLLESVDIAGNGLDGLVGKVAHQISPAADKLGAQRAPDDLDHLSAVIGIHLHGKSAHDLQGGKETVRKEKKYPFKNPVTPTRKIEI